MRQRGNEATKQRGNEATYTQRTERNRRIDFVSTENICPSQLIYWLHFIFSVSMKVKSILFI